MSLVENPQKAQKNLAALGRNRRRLLCIPRGQQCLPTETAERSPPSVLKPSTYRERGGGGPSGRSGADSSLQQVRQLTNALIKVWKEPLTQKDVKNEDSSGWFIENKGAKKCSG